MNYTETISKGIKAIRTINKLTQEQFAEKVNLSINGLRNIEQGKYAPNAITIDTICKTFNISPVELLLPDVDTDLDKLLINKIKALNSKQKEKLNNFLNSGVL